MRTTQAARYARWSAAVAILLITTVSVVYARRAWEAHLTHLTMRLIVPSSVQQQTAGFALSKVTRDRTEYTVRASHATEFTDGGRSVLQDVWVTAYGQDGGRYDNLHTRSCDYLQKTDDIVCGGAVQIDLQSAADAQLHPNSAAQPNPDAQIIHIDTTAVSFNHGSGLATTDQPVTFHFNQGEGRAVGFRYDASKGELTLVSNVEMTLFGSAPNGQSVSSQALEIFGSSLTYYRDRHAIHLVGSVEAKRSIAQLKAGVVDVQLDANLHVQQIVASQNPVVSETDGGEALSVAADRLAAFVRPDGSVEKIEGSRNVRADAKGTTGEDRLQADNAELTISGRANQLKHLAANGNVVGTVNRPDGSRENLASSELQIDFVPDGTQQQARIARATTPAGTLDWQGTAGSAAGDTSETVHLASQHWEALFGGENQIDQLHGTGDSRFERRVGAEPPATATSRDLLVHFDSAGDWSTVDQSGDVKLHDPTRDARADSVHFDHATEAASLSGAVQLSDPDSVTTAQRATLHRATSEFHAEGRVATIEVASAAVGADFGSGPARISSDRLDGNTTKGNAVYSGNARFWQGDSVIEAEAIDLDRSTRVVTANGKVRAVFPEAEATAQAGRVSASQPEFWHAEAGKMTYASDNGRGHLEDRVFAHSEKGSIRSDSMDLFFTPSTSAQGMAPKVSLASTAPNAPSEPGRQLSRAAGFGNVEVTQEDRRGNSSRADYSAAEGKFVLSGGSPTVHDSSGNSVAGRELTLFYADDTIIVDSAEGKRTLTLHPVGK